MTSSLVGSEMCIRDRCGSHPGSQQGGLTWGYHGSVGTGMVLKSRRFRGTVSYTHLTLPTICSV
eukprot:1500889-Prorocentrum_lima.AAC.1